MAAKGLLGLYRKVGAEMLKKRDRGKDAAMGLRSGDIQEMRFGEEAPGEIEGIELLEKWKEEEQRKKLVEMGLFSDGEDANWAKWDVEEDGSDDSGGWINVESDAEIEISDTEDDEPPVKKQKKGSDNASDDREKKDTPAEEPPEEGIAEKSSLSKLATTRILTPADLAKLAELRSQASVSALLPGSKSGRARQVGQSSSNRHIDDPLTAAEIEGLAGLSKEKATREEKIAHAKGMKTDRDEFKSKIARRKERKQEQGKSTTNKEKARKKNFLMTLGKAKSKGKRSLVETRRVLKAHHERSKRGGKRGNRG